MKKNYMSIIMLALICAIGINKLSAQETKSETKVVVIEKTIDKDGNVSVQKTIKSGDEASDYINNTQKEIEMMENEKSQNQKIQRVSSNKHIKIVKSNDGDTEEVFEWSGDGEIPEDMKSLMEEENIFVEVDQSTGGRVIVKVIDGDDEEEIIIDGDDMHLMDEFVEGDEIKYVSVIKRDKNRKAQLGVMIEDAKSGVLINKIIEGSAAEKAGLREGDIIQKINGESITNIEQLVNSIIDKNPNDAIDVVYLRDGEPVAKKIVLQEYDADAFEKEDDHEKMIIIRKKD